MNGTGVVRINVSLPSDLIADVKRVAPKRGMSGFLAEAAREKLKVMRARKAFEEILAAPPAFPEIKDSVAWVRKSRAEDEKRLKRLWAKR